MTCGDYSFYNPAGWFCAGAEALGKGIVGGMGEGAEATVSNVFSNLGDKISDSVQQAWQNLSQLSSADMGQKFGANVNDFVKSFLSSSQAADSFDNPGQKLGEFLNREVVSLMKSFNFANMTRQAGDEFSQGWDEGFQNLNMKERIDILRDEVTPAIDSFMAGIRENTIRQLDLMRDDMQQVMTNASRDAVLETLPWVLLGMALVTAIPLTVLYTYYKMKHNIGKPKLIQERNSANLIDKVYHGAVSASWSIYASAKGFIKGYTFGAVTLIAGSILASLASFGKSLVDYGSSYYLYEPTIPFSLPGNVICQITAQDNCNPQSQMNYYPALYLCLAAGASIATYRMGQSIYQGVASWFKKEDMPIFNDSIQDTINDIVSSTKNCKKHGGYFENVILYGPGGTGKTMISKYIAKNSNMNYVIMSGGDLAQHIKRGEHVTELNKLFEDAKNATGPTILFIDEAESLCKDRDKINDNEHMELINAFLNHTGESSCAKKIMLILATNRLSDIDPAVLSRMDHKISVTPPELEQRVQILNMHAKKFFSSQELKEFFAPEQVLKIAEATEGLTGRDLFKMLNSISNKKAGTTKNMLTQEIIDTMVKRYVEQEKLVSKQVLTTQPKAREVVAAA